MDKPAVYGYSNGSAVPTWPMVALMGEKCFDSGNGCESLTKARRFYQTKVVRPACTSTTFRLTCSRVELRAGRGQWTHFDLLVSHARIVRRLCYESVYWKPRGTERRPAANGVLLCAPATAPPPMAVFGCAARSGYARGTGKASKRAPAVGRTFWPSVAARLIGESDNEG